MNNSSFQSKLRFFVFFIFAIFIIQSVFVIYSVLNSDLLTLEKDKIVTFQVIFLLIGIVLGLVFYFYLPKLLNKSFEPIEKVFEEMRKGKFETRIPEKYKKGPVSSLVHITNEMIKKTNNFHIAKINKIAEYKKRVAIILKNSDDAMIIIDAKFKIQFINESAKKLLGIYTSKEQPLLMDFHFEGEILKYFKEALTKRTIIEERKIYYPKMKKHISFRNGMVHDNDGNFKGIVFVIANLDLRKLNEKEKKKKKVKNQDKKPQLNMPRISQGKPEIKKVLTIKVHPTNQNSGIRVDKYLASLNKKDLYSRNYIAKLIKNNFITVNGNFIKKSEPVFGNETIKIHIPVPSEKKLLLKKSN